MRQADGRITPFVVVPGRALDAERTAAHRVVGIAADLVDPAVADADGNAAAVVAVAGTGRQDDLSRSRHRAPSPRGRPSAARAAPRWAAVGQRQATESLALPLTDAPHSLSVPDFHRTRAVAGAYGAYTLGHSVELARASLQNPGESCAGGWWR